MERVLYLEPDEEITSVVDRIKELKAKNIALVVPRDAVVLQSVVNLKLLKKESEKLKKDLSLVTSDRVGRNLASQVGLPVFDKLAKEFLEPEEEKMLAESSEEKISEDEEISEEPTNEPKEEPKGKLKELTAEKEKSSFEKTLLDGKKSEPFKSLKEPTEPAGFSKPKLRINKKMLIFGIVFSIFVLAFITFLFLPKANISLIVLADKFENKFDLTADKNLIDVNSEKKSIPAQLIEAVSEKEGEGTATGQKQIGEKAKGKVTIYNSYDSGAQALSAGTRLSKSGKTFLLSARVTIPGFSLQQGNPVPGTAEASIEAEKEGADYNISAGKFSISGYPADKFYGQSTTAMSGGYSKMVTVISQGDIDGVKNNLTSAATEEVKKELQKKVSNDSELLDDALKIDVVEFSTSSKVDEQQTKFSGKLKIKAFALIYKKADFEKITTEVFEKIITSKGKELASIDFAKLKKEVAGKDFDKGQMKISVSGDAFAAPKLDEAKLKTNLTGKDRIRAEEYLTDFAEIESAQIELWPFWVKKVPSLEESIRIKVEYKENKTKSDQSQVDQSTANQEQK